MGYRTLFEEQGVFMIEGAVSPDALRWAGSALDAFIEEHSLHERPSRGVSVIPCEGGRAVVATARPYQYLGAVPLYLLGLPAVGEAVEAACGPDAVCTTEWMVIKNANDQNPVDWHQDFVHDGDFPVINVGIQLDDTHEDAVRFVPGARRGAEDICAVKARYDYDDPTLLSAPAAAGALTVHDVLLVHGSPALRGQSRRRTLYLEFRPLAMLRDHPHLNGEYLQLRRDLLGLARGVVERLGEHPDGDPHGLLSAEERTLIQRLDEFNVVIEGAHYCLPEFTAP